MSRRTWFQVVLGVYAGWLGALGVLGYLSGRKPVVKAPAASSVRPSAPADLVPGPAPAPTDDGAAGPSDR